MLLEYITSVELKERRYRARREELREISEPPARSACAGVHFLPLLVTTGFSGGEISLRRD